MQRDKGHGFERSIAAALRPIFPKAIRNLEYQEGLGVDLTNTGNLRIQCKRGRKYCSLSKIEEVPEVAGKIPLLITQGDRKEALVALRLVDFIAILKNPDYAKGSDHGATSKGKEVREERGEEAGEGPGNETECPPLLSGLCPKCLATA